MSLGGLGVDDLRKDIAKHGPAIKRGAEEISKKISAVWKQEPIELDLNVIPGSRLDIKVKDGTIKGVRLGPEQRSNGFQWYLAFYANFLGEAEGTRRNSILLLDEPGIFLYAKGQVDLLSIFEAIADKGNQIIYSTHSGFMVSRDYPERVRYLVKRSKGTFVDNTAWSRGTQGTLPETIRASLGMLLADSLLYSKINVIVEGPSDKIILREAIEWANRSNKKPIIDLQKVSILPAYSASKVPVTANFLRNENIPIVVVLDSDSEGKRTAEVLGDREILKELIVTIAECGGDESFQTIEDLVPKPVLMAAVNAVGSREVKNWSAVSAANFKGYYPIAPRLKDVMEKRGNTDFDFFKIRIARTVASNMKGRLEPDPGLFDAEFPKLKKVVEKVAGAIQKASEQ